MGVWFDEFLGKHYIYSPISGHSSVFVVFVFNGEGIVCTGGVAEEQYKSRLLGQSVTDYAKSPARAVYAR